MKGDSVAEEEEEEEERGRIKPAQQFLAAALTFRHTDTLRFNIPPPARANAQTSNNLNYKKGALGRKNPVCTTFLAHSKHPVASAKV